MYLLRCRSQDQCCCFCKALDRGTEACTCHRASHMPDYLPSGFGDWYTEKEGWKTYLMQQKYKQNAVFCVNKVIFQYPVDKVVDVIIHISFCVKGIASFPVFLISFEEKVSECHEIFLFEFDHHFVAQAKRDQLIGKLKNKNVMRQLTASCTFTQHEKSDDASSHLDCDDCDL